MQRICTSLANAGYDVLLVGRKLPHSVPITSKIYKQKRLKCLFNQSFLFYAEYNIRLFFLLLFLNCDLICSIDLDTILPGFITAKLKNKTFVHDAHELFTEMPELDEKPLVKKTWQIIETFIFPKLKYAYTESEGYKTVYENKYPKTKFHVIRNVPFYYSTTKRHNNESYILYQGALNVGRGLEQTLLVMQHINYPLWLAGEGDMSEKLREQVKELGLKEKVKFLGWLTPEELRKVTVNAKIGLNLLTPENLHYQLSFPNKLFDYMMAELPQVTMNFSMYKLIVQQKNIGVLIDDFQVESIKSAIEFLLTNEEYYNECVAACSELKQIHHWGNEEEKLLRFYKNLSL